MSLIVRIIIFSIITSNWKIQRPLLGITKLQIIPMFGYYGVYIIIV